MVLVLGETLAKYAPEVPRFAFVTAELSQHVGEIQQIRECILSVPNVNLQVQEGLDYSGHWGLTASKIFMLLAPAKLVVFLDADVHVATQRDRLIQALLSIDLRQRSSRDFPSCSRNELVWDIQCQIKICTLPFSAVTL